MTEHARRDLLHHQKLGALDTNSGIARAGFGFDRLPVDDVRVAFGVKPTVRAWIGRHVPILSQWGFQRAGRAFWICS